MLSNGPRGVQFNDFDAVENVMAIPCTHVNYNILIQSAVARCMYIIILCSLRVQDVPRICTHCDVPSNKEAG